MLNKVIHRYWGLELEHIFRKTHVNPLQRTVASLHTLRTNLNHQKSDPCERVHCDAANNNVRTPALSRIRVSQSAHSETPNVHFVISMCQMLKKSFQVF